MSRPITKEEFENATPFEKGYLVYICGCRDDQPNVPSSYEPTEEERAEFKRGEAQAVLDAQDSEE